MAVQSLLIIDAGRHSLSKLNGQTLNFYAGATDMSAQAVNARRKPL
jgi:hypothetical protein